MANNSFSDFVKQINKNEKDRINMSKNKSSKGSGKNSAIKSGNPAFKPTKSPTKKMITGKAKSLNNNMWRGMPKGK